MKKIAMLAVVGYICIGTSQAQSQTETTRPVKVEAKEALKQAEAKPTAIEAAKIAERGTTVRRIESSNANSAVMTEEQMKAVMAERKAKGSNEKKKDDQ